MTQQEIDNLISHVSTTDDPGSVTNEEVGAVLDDLNRRIKQEPIDRQAQMSALASSVARDIAVKADKTELNALSNVHSADVSTLSDNIADVADDLDNETQSRKEADAQLAEKIETMPHPITVKDTDLGDLVIADEDETPIFTVKGGHIKTANFDSANIRVSGGSGVSPVTVKDITNADLIIADEDESPLLTVNGGHVSTSGFNSYETVTGEGSTNALSVNSISYVANNASAYAFRGINRCPSEDVILRHIDMARSTSDAVGQTVTILAGQIDQRGWLIGQHSTEAKIISITDGVARIKPSTFFMLNAGDYVFVSVPSSGNKVNATASEQGSYYNILEYGSSDPSDIAVNYRTDIRFYKFNAVVSAFSRTNLWQAIKSALDGSSQALTNSLSAQTDAASARYLRDTVTGYTYRLKVTNGQLGIKSVGYHNILVLGNSFTNHPANQAYGFKCVRGMAASTDLSDYCAYIAEGTGAMVTRAIHGTQINCVDFEKFYSTSPISLDDIEFDRDVEYDAIIVQLSENANYTATMQAAWESLYQYLIDLYPEAPILQIIGWDMTTQKTGAISAACNAKGVTLLNCDAETKTGQFSVGAYNLNNDGVQRPITAQIVGHPSDVGMLLIANRVLKALGVAELDYLHMIDIVVPTGSGIQIYVMQGRVGGLNKGAYRQLVTLNVSGASNVTVTDSDNNNIEVTKHSSTRYTFIMPNKAVTVRGIQ